MALLLMEQTALKSYPGSREADLKLKSYRAHTKPISDYFH